MSDNIINSLSDDINNIYIHIDDAKNIKYVYDDNFLFKEIADNIYNKNSGLTISIIDDYAHIDYNYDILDNKEEIYCISDTTDSKQADDGGSHSYKSISSESFTSNSKQADIYGSDSESNINNSKQADMYGSGSESFTSNSKQADMYGSGSNIINSKCADVSCSGVYEPIILQSHNDSPEITNKSIVNFESTNNKFIEINKSGEIFNDDNYYENKKVKTLGERCGVILISAIMLLGSTKLF